MLYFCLFCLFSLPLSLLFFLFLLFPFLYLSFFVISLSVLCFLVFSVFALLCLSSPYQSVDSLPRLPFLHPSSTRVCSLVAFQFNVYSEFLSQFVQYSDEIFKVNAIVVIRHICSGLRARFSHFYCLPTSKQRNRMYFFFIFVIISLCYCVFHHVCI